MTIARHLKTRDLADLLGVSTDTLLRLKDAGELRPVKLGRDLIWPVRDVEAFLAARTVDYSRVRLVRERRSA